MPVIEREIGTDGVGVVTLNRPEKRNALSSELLSAIESAFMEWGTDPRVRVIVLTGADGAFCAGFDLTEIADPERLPEMFQISASYHRTVWACPKIVIAAIDGPALGGGLDLATLCDMRIASSAALFGHPEIRFGAPPIFTPLRWIVGDGRARELCLTGRRIDADEAASIGLVSRVVEPGHALEEALGVARDLTAVPERCLATTKRYLTGNAGLGFEDSFRVEHDDVFRAQIEAASLWQAIEPS